MGSDSYHHGNLRVALLDAGYVAAARGGPSALVIRELARAVGVSPTAAYHHFADLEHLHAEVSQRAREALAARMRTAHQEVPARGARATRAVRRLAAIAHGYLDFARAEPQLLRMAFAPCTVAASRPDDPDAWEILVSGLDELDQVGAMDRARRPGAELIVWSAVHGMAVLRADGAFTVDPADTPDQVAAAGLAASPAGDAVIVAGILAALGCPPIRPPRPTGTRRG